jgi:hypothetical protein
LTNLAEVVNFFRKRAKFFHQQVNCDPKGDSDIERLFFAELGNLKDHVGCRQNTVVNACDLVPDN